MSEMQQIAKEQDKHLSSLTDDLVLLDSGFDSLCFAILVARLEDKLGFDPFTLADDTTLPLTFGDLVRVYDNAHADAAG